MQPVILGLAKLVSLTAAATCLHSPPAWSPDGQWLAYTIQEAGSSPVRQPGWLFDAERLLRPESPAGGDERPGLPGPAGRCKLWVSQPALGHSVLLEECPGLLSAPGWSPDGRRLAFLRFLADSKGPAAGLVQGRCELVVQVGLDQKKVELTLPSVALGPEQITEFPAIQPAWSPDGTTLMVDRPGLEPAILIVQPGKQSIRKTLLGARHASWSPEGSRVAVVVSPAGGLADQRIQILGLDSGPPRTLPGDYAMICGPPTWSVDGQSILIAARRPQLRNRGIELIRVQVDSGITSPLLPFVSLPGISRMDTAQPLPAGAAGARGLPWVWMSFDRDRELCVFAADLPGQDPVIGFCNVRVPQTFKRFPPIDAALRLGALAMDPGGRSIAVRVEGAGKTGPLFLCELGSEDVTLLTPDPPARREWAATLTEAALVLLRAALPPPSVDGAPVARLSVLPLAGEISRQTPFPARLLRIAKLGRALGRQVRTESQPDLRDPSSPEEGIEARLFFDALAGDSAAAEADLDELVETAETAEMRLRLLALRAQILHGAGQTESARSVVDYLLETQRRPSHRIEETPAGMVVSPGEDPLRGWLVYLRSRFVRSPDDASRAAGAEDGAAEGVIDLRLPARGIGRRGPGPEAPPRPPFPGLVPGPDARIRFRDPQGRADEFPSGGRLGASRLHSPTGRSSIQPG